MLELKDVNQYYGGSHILRNVSLDAKIGEITVVLGRNGVGMSVWWRCILAANFFVGAVPPRLFHVSFTLSRGDTAPTVRVSHA